MKEWLRVNWFKNLVLPLGLFILCIVQVVLLLGQELQKPGSANPLLCFSLLFTCLLFKFLHHRGGW